MSTWNFYLCLVSTTVHNDMFCSFFVRSDHIYWITKMKHINIVSSLESIEKKSEKLFGWVCLISTLCLVFNCSKVLSDAFWQVLNHWHFLNNHTLFKNLHQNLEFVKLFCDWSRKYLVFAWPYFCTTVCQNVTAVEIFVHLILFQIVKNTELFFIG